MTTSSSVNICHACNHSAPLLKTANILHCVTSDCRPWAAQADFAVCHTCGLAQKKITPTWTKETEAIYGSYTMYPQGGGEEQTSFESNTGVAQARSKKIIDAILSNDLIPAQGAMLDVGCGNGNMMRSFQGAFPKWNLAGQEWDERHAEIVSAIPNVTDFFTRFPDDHLGYFDLISMIHVLEHIVDPVSYLQKLTSLLRPGGLILIEVPNLRRNPYDLAIFDHCSHFTASSLKILLAQAGLRVNWLSENVIPKELTVLCSVGSSETTSVSPEEIDVAKDSIIWLQNFKAQTAAVDRDNQLGIFGTSIGASWVVSELGHAPDFFLDEDKNRIGKYHLDKPILASDQAPQGSSIIIPLTTESANAVSARISRPDLTLYCPS